MGRAVAHAKQASARFRDPTAMTLLPAEAQQRVRDFVAGVPPRGLRDHLAYGRLRALMGSMTVRSLAIDDALVRAAAAQVVILGAGLDGRAWRMPELHEAVVFEVDHPDTQRDKRARIGALTQRAHEVRFVPVDFTRDSLDAQLEAAGHDASRPTTWIWEGVVMYLTVPQVEATLEIIARRSATSSVLLLLYSHPSLYLKLVGLMVRGMGEPFRSSFGVEEMRALLQRFDFSVTQDADIASLGRAHEPEIQESVGWMRHMRLVAATKI